jgi:polyisoprenoid-binding protein YceI
MPMKILTILFAGLIFMAQAASAAAYKIDPAHSQIHFTVVHLMVFKVKGEFTDYAGEIIADSSGKSLQSASARIQVASIDTRVEKRDKHLRSADFFDAANHPEMSFESTSIEGSGDNITVRGNLTIRGKTREVVLTGKYLGEAIDASGNQRSGFEAAGKINRHDFGLSWNKALETGGFVVGDDVELGLEIEAIKQ